MSSVPTVPSDVQRVYDALPKPQSATLLAVRHLIFEVGSNNQSVGPIEEALRWGELAYLTTQSKSGSTVRLGVDRASGSAAVFFNCKTTLVEEFRQQFGGLFEFSKNRAILLDAEADLPVDALAVCIAAALTYHLRR